MAMIEQGRLSCEGTNDVVKDVEFAGVRTKACEVREEHARTLSPADFITASEETAQNLLLMIRAEKARHAEEETR